MLVYLVLVSNLILQSETSHICRNILMKELHEEDITEREQVSQNNDIELHIKTNLTYEGKDSILLKSELLGLTEEDIRTPLGLTSLPLFFHGGQSGRMKSWQVDSYWLEF